MISTTPRTLAHNSYVLSLEELLNGRKTTVDWLVIAHHDPAMVLRVQDALTGKSAALLQVPQERWRDDEQALSEAICWAIETQGISTVVLVGHSAAGLSKAEARLAASPVEHQRVSASPIAAARLAESQRLSAEQHLAEQLQSLSERPTVAQRLSESKLTLYGLLYRAESGIFAIYNPQDNTFAPLIAADEIAA